MEPMKPEDAGSFYEEDEDVAEVFAMFDAGPADGVTARPEFHPDAVQRLLRAVYGEPEPVCTCVLGNPDHSGDCFCTTSIMECGLHRYTRLGQLEARLVREHQERRP